MGIPVLLAALCASACMGVLQRVRRHLGRSDKVMGGLLILTGILIMTGSMNEIGFWMQQVFPALGQAG